MLYTLNLYRVMCQLYLNKSGIRKKMKNSKMKKMKDLFSWAISFRIKLQ